MFPSTTTGPIEGALVKTFLRQRLSFSLPDHIWDEVDNSFRQIWNELLGYGAWFYWDEITEMMFSDLTSRQILMAYEQVDEIATLILTYMEENGGFLDDDRS